MLAFAVRFETYAFPNISVNQIGRSKLLTLFAIWLIGVCAARVKGVCRCKWLVWDQGQTDCEGVARSALSGLIRPHIL